MTQTGAPAWVREDADTLVIESNAICTGPARGHRTYAPEVTSGRTGGRSARAIESLLLRIGVTVCLGSGE